MFSKKTFGSLFIALEQVKMSGAVFPVHGINQNRNCTCGKLNCSSAGKHPACAKGVNDATRDLVKLKALWRNRKNLNIGLATGGVSGVWVLDIDGEEGEKTLAKLISDNGSLPATLESNTGRGRHLFFLCPDKKVMNRVALGLKIDVRGDGGYVVIPPSRHITGVCYEFIDITIPVVKAPSWLESLVTRGKNSATEAVRKSSAEWDKIIKGVAEGCRNDSITRLSGLLFRLHARIDTNISLELILAFNEARCNPPLSHEEVMRITTSIAGRELSKNKRLNHD